MDRAGVGQDLAGESAPCVQPFLGGDPSVDLGPAIRWLPFGIQERAPVREDLRVDDALEEAAFTTQRSVDRLGTTPASAATALTVVAA